MNPALRIGVPVLVLQGEADTVVPQAFTDQLVYELTARGDAVRYERFPAVNHAAIVAAADQVALRSFARWFRMKRG